MNNSIPFRTYCLAADAAIIESRQERRQVPLLPTPPGFGENRFAVFRHFRDESARRSGLLVPRPPNQHFQEDGGQVDPFFGQTVIHSSPIRFFRLRRDESRRLQLLQTVCQDVGGNPFPRFLKLLKCPKSTNHQIPNNQQRPPVSKQLESDAHRAAGPAFGLKPARHNRQITRVTCKRQVKFGGGRTGAAYLPGRITFEKAVQFAKRIMLSKPAKVPFSVTARAALIGFTAREKS